MTAPQARPTRAVPGPVVDAAWLAARLGDPDLVVLDATVVLPSPERDGDHRAASGRDGWLGGHVPGSRHADLTGDLAEAGAPTHFTLPTAATLAVALERLGVADGRTVVAYDGGGLWAARLWWMLRWLGVDDAAVLDGGWQAWTAGGHPVASGPDAAPGAPPVAPGRLTVRERPGLWVDRERVLGVVEGRASGTLVCALGAEVFAGTAPTRYARRGHIPGSRLLPARALTGPDGAYRPAADLAATVDAALADAPGPLLLYCGGGISAASDALVLTMLGRDDVAVYDGSLEEWAADPALPLETGGA